MSVAGALPCFSRWSCWLARWQGLSAADGGGVGGQVGFGRVGPCRRMLDQPVSRGCCRLRTAAPGCAEDAFPIVGHRPGSRVHLVGSVRDGRQGGYTGTVAIAAPCRPPRSSAGGRSWSGRRAGAAASPGDQDVLRRTERPAHGALALTRFPSPRRLSVDLAHRWAMSEPGRGSRCVANRLLCCLAVAGVVHRFPRGISDYTILR